MSDQPPPSSRDETPTVRQPSGDRDDKPLTRPSAGTSFMAGAFHNAPVFQPQQQQPLQQQQSPYPTSINTATTTTRHSGQQSSSTYAAAPTTAPATDTQFAITDSIRRLSLSSAAAASTAGGLRSAPVTSSASSAGGGFSRRPYPDDVDASGSRSNSRRPFPPPISTAGTDQHQHQHPRRGPLSPLDGIQSIWTSSAAPAPAPAVHHSAIPYAAVDPSAAIMAPFPYPTQLAAQESRRAYASAQFTPAPHNIAPVADSFSTVTIPTVRNVAGKFPTRPSLGRVGRPIRVRANFFQFVTLPGQDLHHYDVKITPEVPPSLNRRIFGEVIRNYGRERLGGAVAVYDGRRNLYSPAELPALTDGNSVDIEITLSDAHETPGQPSASSSSSLSTAAISPVVTTPTQPTHGPRRFQFRIRYLGRINMDAFGKFLQGDGSDTPFATLQAIDVIMRHRPSMMLTSVGRSFFTRNEFKVLGDGAECWMGYHQSVRATQGQLLLNIDVSATAFYEPGPALAYLARNLGKRVAADLKSPLKQREIEKCDRLMRGVKVQVTHRGEMKRKYKILGMTRTATDMTYFKYTANSTAGDGTPAAAAEVEISVAEYFSRHYNVQLQFPYLPCAKVGTPQRVVYLPLEVCDIVPGQRFLRKLNEQQTAQMIRLTCQTPDRRANKIAQAIGELGLDNFSATAPQQVGDSGVSMPDDARYLDAFGVRLSDEMITIPARILDPPTIQYHPNSREPLITPRDGSWNLRDKKVVQPATLHSWAIICFGTPRDMPQVKIDEFLREMISTCRDTGLNVTNAHPPAIYCDPMTSQVEESMQLAWQAAGEAVQSFPQLIVCILPNTGVPLYAEIKRVGDTVLGVPTQCLQVKHTFVPKKQYCANVCLKINAKLGGVNSFIVKNPHVLGDNGMPWVAEVPTIIFGADITHPVHGESRENGSVCALVGSLDRLASRYAATVRLQPARRELISQLSSMVKEILKIFYLENNQIAPQRILFYRDGVSESHFYDVITQELSMIREACEQLQSGYCPTITYIVVQKRHHARVFAMNPRDADRSGNIPAGTVIDSQITHPNQYDFYLCSHAGLQGTSRPTHYHVLHDENGFTPDMLQELTYRLCFGYARCTRSVSVVPPAYYADLVAFRAKYHMKNSNQSAAGSYSASGGTYSGPFGTASVISGSGREERSAAVRPSGGSQRDDDTVSDSAMSGTERRSGRGGSRRDVAATAAEEEELLKRLSAKLTAVKPELQKVMYFM